MFMKISGFFANDCMIFFDKEIPVTHIVKKISIYLRAFLFNCKYFKPLDL